MSHLLVLATADGIQTFNDSGSAWQPYARGLEGREVTSVIAREGVILAGTRSGIFRSEDAGRSWEELSQGLDIRYVRWLGYHPAISDREFAGTEPAAIFFSDDGGESWHERPEVSELRQRHRWWLPYSSGAGCVRGFAFHGRRGYAAVEVGGVLRSDDQGRSWRLVGGNSGSAHDDDPPAPHIHPDVHSIETHSSSPDLVYAPTGGGFYRSHDGGESWSLRYDCYCRAVWVDPHDAEHLILGPADNVDRNGRIEESRDGGQSWQDASAGLEAPWPRHMVERFLQLDDQLLAVLSNGRLIAAPLDSLHWSAPLPQVQAVRAVAALNL